MSARSAQDEKASDLGLRKSALALPNGVERFAFDLLHHEVERALFFEVLDVARHERMVERRENACLTLGELDVLPAACAAHVEALDRHGAARLHVGRFVGHALRAFPKDTPHDIASAPKACLCLHGLMSSTQLRSRSHFEQERPFVMSPLQPPGHGSIVHLWLAMSQVYSDLPSLEHAELGVASMSQASPTT